MHSSIKYLYRLALTGYFGLLIYLPCQILWLTPAKLTNPLLALAIFWLPLFFPMKGLLQGKTYTFAWTNFLIVIIFMRSLTNLWVSPEELIFTLIELVLASLLFFAGSFYARLQTRYLKARECSNI